MTKPSEEQPDPHPKSERQFQCRRCDFDGETMQAMKEHLETVHEVDLTRAAMENALKVASAMHLDAADKSESVFEFTLYGAVLFGRREIVYRNTENPLEDMA